MAVNQLWTNNTSPPFPQNGVFWVKGRRDDSPEEYSDDEKPKKPRETYLFRRFHPRRSRPY